jgi:hypothetical protein
MLAVEIEFQIPIGFFLNCLNLITIMIIYAIYKMSKV